jgi:hypothetical protein
MKGLRYVVVGSIAGLAASTVSARASAMCWQPQPGCATSISVGAADAPAVVGCGAGNVYAWEPVTGTCNGGFCPTAPEWVQVGALAGAQFVSADPDGDVTALDTSGQIWFDPNGALGSVFEPSGDWQQENDVTPPGQCFGSYQVIGWTGFLGSTSSLVLATPCGSTDLWYGVFQNGGSFQVQAPFPGGGAAQTAGFFNPMNTNIVQAWVPWAVAQDGTLWAFDGSTWGQQPGWEVTAITDHFVVGYGGNVYEWEDEAPNFLPGQPMNGNWSAPVIGPTPNGPPWQLAYASTGTLGQAPSSLWALDYSGGIWKMQESCTVVPQ